MAVRITEEYLIKKLTKFVEQHHRTPTVKEFGYQTPIRTMFKNYTTFLESQGLGKKQVIEYYTKIEIAEKLHAFVRSHQRAPKASEFGYRYAIKNYFDSYFDFIKAHGYESLYDKSLELKPRAKPKSEPKKSRKTKPRQPMTIEMVINELHLFAKEHGRTPISTELGHMHIINKYFGTYNNFLRSQGYPLNTPGKNKPLTKDGLIKKLNDFISINDRVPTRKEFGQINQIKKIYGSFDAFIRANGYEPLPSRRAKKKLV